MKGQRSRVLYLRWLWIQVHSDGAMFRIWSDIHSIQKVKLNNQNFLFIKTINWQDQMKICFIF